MADSYKHKNDWLRWDPNYHVREKATRPMTDHVEVLRRIRTVFGVGPELRAIDAAISAMTVDEARPRCGDERYELDAYIWKRESTQEWVLELSGTIGDAHFISRHCEPLTTPPEDVAGLPSIYAVIQGGSRE